MTSKADEAWQLRLLPLMMAFVIGAAVFFSAVVLWRFVEIDDQMGQPGGGGLAAAEASRLASALSPDTQAALSLERYVIERRYQQASLTVRARLWTRFVGFITGMLLALVGAVFVLGKLNDLEPHQASGNAEVGGHKLGFAFTSASPGIILAGLGTILMALTIAIPGQASTNDSATYYRGLVEPAAGALEAAALAPAPPCPNGETDPLKCPPPLVQGSPGRSR
jgi:hypothetical protein